MDETLISFEIVHLPFNTPILVSFPLIEESLKFFYGGKLRHCISLLKHFGLTYQQRSYKLSPRGYINIRIRSTLPTLISSLKQAITTIGYTTYINLITELRERIADSSTSYKYTRESAHTHTHTHMRERERETDRQTDRQRQRDRPTETDRLTDRQTDRQAEFSYHKTDNTRLS